MTGRPTAPPGWYPDPDGTPGRARWWNGAGWSDVTTAAGPGVAVQQAAAVQQMPASREGAAESAAGTGPFEPRRPARRTGWVIGLSVLGLVLAVLIGLLVGRPSSSVERPAAAAPPPPAGPAFPPGTVRVVDEAAGIAYPYLGPGWFEYGLQAVVETTSVAGQYLVTQEATPDGGPFIAQCTSGPLSPLFDRAGGLQPTLAEVADSVRLNYYPAPNEREVLRDEARTVDGAPAHLVEFDLSWQVDGYEASGERAALLLVDVGRPDPALLYISVPNTHAELYGVIDRVVEGVEVL